MTVNNDETTLHLLKKYFIGNSLQVSAAKDGLEAMERLKIPFRKRMEKKMDCPICEALFSKFKEVLLKNDRSFCCHLSSSETVTSFLMWYFSILPRRVLRFIPRS
jgi:hypothetical protein